LTIPGPIKGALEGAGINATALDRIRLARGIVGKASYVAGAALLVLAAVALVLRQPEYLLIDAILAVVLFVAYFVGTLWFANRHPEIAILEGAELIQWRQMEIASAKGMTSTLEPTPNVEPPLIEQGRE
jgi:hypothetical protein